CSARGGREERQALRAGDSRIAATDATGEWITLALVIKTQGRRGEVAVELHTDVPDRLRQGMRLWALGKSGERRELTIEELWPHKSLMVLKFAAVETISDAETLKGCMVFDGEREIGKIVDVAFGAGEAPLLVVNGGAKLPYEIPFAEAYLEKVDVERKQVRMRLPDGLLGVNAPVTKEEKEKNR